MPNKSEKKLKIVYTPEFKRNLRILAKKYRHIRSDIQPVIKKLQAGEFPGDQIQETGFTLFKVRVQNSDIGKGKRSGYRLIYYIITPINITFVTIYSKTDQSDIPAEKVRHIIMEYSNLSQSEKNEKKQDTSNT